MKKNDLVLVCTGDDKGKEGRILKMIGDYVLVAGIKMKKKHTKANPNKKLIAGIYEKEMPIHISNLKIQNG